MKMAQLDYIPISSQNREIIPHKIVQTYLELQDYEVIKLDSVTRIEMSDLFRLNKQAVLPYEKFDNTWMSVTVEMNLDLI